MEIGNEEMRTEERDSSVNQSSASFTYTYSAKQQEEIKAIRSKYLPREEDKMAQLRRLDAGAAKKGSAAALALGVLSTLLLGVGMCCTMVFSQKWFVPGIVIGLLGIAGICAAYPVYTAITRREREKIAPEIIRLTDELMK